MDVISLSKASKAIKDKATYQSEFLGEGVEAHFSSLDERLDWLEGMYSSAQIQETINLLAKDAEMENVEFVDGKLVLTHESFNDELYKKDYKAVGTYRNAFDLGNNLISIAAQAFLKNTTENQEARIQYESSEDGITYDAPQEWSPTTYPKKRYVRLTITLTSNHKVKINHTTNPVLESNPFIKENKLIKSVQMPMSRDESWGDES